MLGIGIFSIVSFVGYLHTDAANKYITQSRHCFQALKNFNRNTLSACEKCTLILLSVPRRITLPLIEKMKAQLQFMERQGVISKVDVLTYWCF